MTLLCLWSPDWRTGAAPAPELARTLLEVAPRVRTEQVVWVDARGLPAMMVAEAALDRARSAGAGDPRVALAAVPVAAEMAARTAPRPITQVAPGTEREFLAPHPLALLCADSRLLGLLRAVGITRCGELAALSREAVEVRFGAAGSRLWRLARADDPRLLFAPIPRELPHASLDWTEYVLRDPERLVFVINALLGNVCTALGEQGEGARALTLAFELANGARETRTLRTARSTAARPIWMRRVRALLETLVLPDAVAGVSLWVEAAEPVTGRQGDLFDSGVTGADAAEASLVRLLDDHGPVVVVPQSNRHPLVERRTRWIEQDPEVKPATGSPELDLFLQLLPEPLPVAVKTRSRRDHLVPVQYRAENRWLNLVSVAGPDRASGGWWEEVPFAREYFRCVSEQGVLVWLFRDARENTWFLHGWWD